MRVPFVVSALLVLAAPGAAQDRPAACRVSVDLAGQVIALQRSVNDAMDHCLLENGGDPLSATCQSLLAFSRTFDAAAVTATLRDLEDNLAEICDLAPSP